MHHVYLLESLTGAHHYVGLTTDLDRRLTDHNTGKLPHTSLHKPWRLVTSITFTDATRAAHFERYLKSGSGHAFARKHLW